jgi:hypothetical protein
MTPLKAAMDESLRDGMLAMLSKDEKAFYRYAVRSQALLHILNAIATRHLLPRPLQIMQDNAVAAAWEALKTTERGQK